MKKHAFLMLVLTVCLAVFCGCSADSSSASSDIAKQYEAAIDLLKDSNYADAGTAFASLGSYADAPRYVMYCNALVAGESGNYAIAVTNFSSLGDFLDSSLLTKYYTGLQYEQSEEYENALEALSGITLYRDVAERVLTYPEKIQERDYKVANDYEQDGNLTAALNTFKGLGSYKDSADRAKAVQEKINEQNYTAADKAEQCEDFSTAYDIFVSLGDYKDSEGRAATVQQKASYAKGLAAIDEGNYAIAYNIFKELGDYEDSQEKAYVLGISDVMSVTPIGDNLACVSYYGYFGTLCGLINFEKNLLIAPKWESVDMFNDGVAVVEKDGLYGIIDTEGNVVSECKWADISAFSNGVCVVAEKDASRSSRWSEYYSYMLMDKDGRILSDKWASIGYSSSRYGAYAATPQFHEDLITVKDQNGNCGFINSKGEVVIEPVYSEASDFSCELAAVKMGEEWGYIDTAGKVVISFKYSSAGSFSENTGWAVVATSGEYKVIDKTGATIY